MSALKTKTKQDKKLRPTRIRDNKMRNNIKAKVYNLIILDKSGSMNSIANAAVSGFNETLEGIRSAQKQFADTQEHYVSLLPFCACSMDYVYNCVPIRKARRLTHREYRPCCCTPLYDAMGKGITELFRKTKEEKAAAVIVTVITDGMENASKEYSGKAIKALVDKMKEEYGWNFSYIGTNQDVESVAANLSIPNTMYFEDTHEGLGAACTRDSRSRNRMYCRIDSFFSNVFDDNQDSINERVEKVHDMLRKHKNFRELEEFSHRITPDRVRYLKDEQIFVFGSNTMGNHNGGAACDAALYFGAIMGQAEGLQGQSYAIPSTDGMDSLSKHVRTFIDFANRHPELTFLVTRIGCGVAGYTVQEVAPLFAGVVDMENVWLPKEFWEELI